MEKKIPTYDVVFNDEMEFEAISLVDEPAIGVQFVAFKDQMVKFSVDTDKKMVMGPVLIPDIPIYRNTIKAWGECNIIFSKDTIEKMAAKFSRQGSSTALNLNHSDETVKAFIFESWIIEDSKMDKSTLKGYDLPVGTWMATVKIEDEDFWNNKVKKGEVTGFSIESFLSISKPSIRMKKQSKILNMNTNKIKMEKESITSWGDILYTESDWTKGSSVYYKDDEGQVRPAGDGHLIVEADGKKLVISSEFGKITQVLETIEPTTEQTNQNKNMKKNNLEKDVKLEDGTIIYTPDDDFKVDSEVYLDPEYTKYVEDKEWTLEDGRVIVTVGGKITEIREAVEQVTEEDEEKIADEEVKAEIDPAVQAMIDDYNSFKEEIRAAIAELVSKYDSITNSEVDVVEEFKKVNQSIEKLMGPGGKSMVAKPTNLSKEDSKKSTEDDYVAKIKKLSALAYK